MTTAHAAELRGILRARDDADPAVAPSMRSRLIEGDDDRAIILLHGLTASPPVWESIAADLAAQGATVINLRLPLHGHGDRMSSALERLGSDLLIADLRAVVEAVARLGKRITVGGHSLGGTLAVYAAASLPHVERAVGIAPFLGIAGVPHELHAALIPAIRALPNVFLWWDPVERERLAPGHGYPRYPLHALAVGLEIASAIDRAGARIAPERAIDLVVNAGESSVSNRAVRRLAARWRRGGAAVAVHELAGLPPSHDIIDPSRSNSSRARPTLVRLLLGQGGAGSAARYPI